MHKCKFFGCGCSGKFTIEGEGCQRPAIPVLGGDCNGRLFIWLGTNWPFSVNWRSIRHGRPLQKIVELRAEQVYGFACNVNIMRKQNYVCLTVQNTTCQHCCRWHGRWRVFLGDFDCNIFCGLQRREPVFRSSSCKQIACMLTSLTSSLSPRRDPPLSASNLLEGVNGGSEREAPD